MVLNAPSIDIILPAALQNAAGQDPDVVIEGWTWGCGETPGSCTLHLPDTATDDHSAWADGEAVYIFRARSLVFAGHTVADDEAVGAATSAVRITARDVRHAMAARQVGQYGIGSVATVGGWPQCGYDVVFNRRARPNRSATADATTGIYTWDTTAAAEYWTYEDIIRFLFHWYVDTTVCQVRAADLTGPFADPAPEINCATGSVRAAVHRVMSTMGGLWTVTYSGTYGSGVYTAYFTPVVEGISPASTYTLVLDKPGTTVHTPTSLTVTNVEVSHATDRNFDRVEIHSAPKIVETTLTSAGSGLLDRVSSGDDLPDDSICYFAPDVTDYAAFNLGRDLPAASLPRPWLADLATRRTDAGYVAAGTSRAVGRPVPCRECIWLSWDAGSTYYRLRSGVRIDRDRMRIYLDRDISYYGDTADASARKKTLKTADTANLELRITVATRIESPVVSGTAAGSLYLSTQRTRRIVRSDLVPRYRYNAELPDLASADPNARTTAASGAIETYDDVTTELEYIRDNIWDARDSAESELRCSLEFFPALAVGDGVSLSPLDLGLPDDMRITELQLDPSNMRIRLRATNNPDGSAA